MRCFELSDTAGVSPATWLQAHHCCGPCGTRPVHEDPFNKNRHHTCYVMGHQTNNCTTQFSACRQLIQFDDGAGAIARHYEYQTVTFWASLMFPAWRPVALSVCVFVLLAVRTAHGARPARLAVETKHTASSAITWTVANATQTSFSLASWSTSGPEPLWLHNWLPQETAAARAQPSNHGHQPPQHATSNSQPAAPHKPLLPYMDKWDFILLACAAVTLFIAAGGGIGGGAIFVPLYIWAGGKLATLLQLA